ncbi:MAG TPA: hypothetical protein VLW25_07200 [Bryobacteraceae bacterium]|nr:hypothetical protein [Bryobacteraceae bacterium]
MHKVIVERPRLLRARWENKKTALRLTKQQSAQAMDAAEDYDSGPRRASSRRHEKWLNENLAPLRRYLMRQVGRPWDKVYGEIRQTIDTRSAIGLHVLQHLEDYVATDAFLEDGVVCEWRWRGGAVPVDGLYVHPKTGLLRFAKRRKTPRQAPPLDTVRVSQTVQYRKIDGLWFRMEYRRAEPDELVPADHGKLVRAAELGRSSLVLVRKQQCDRKTIRQIEAMNR